MDTEHPSDEVHGEVERGQRDKPWQRYLDATLGLRNYWYPVLFTHELKEGETRAETLLGERLFLKRINGTVHCVDSVRGRQRLAWQGASEDVSDF